MYVQPSIPSLPLKLTFWETGACHASIDAVVARRLVALSFEGIERRRYDEYKHEDGNCPVEVIRVEACADGEAAVKLAQK